MITFGWWILFENLTCWKIIMAALSALNWNYLNKIKQQATHNILRNHLSFKHCVCGEKKSEINSIINICVD